MMNGTDSWLQILKVKAGQPIGGVPNNGATDDHILYAYMDWDIWHYVLPGIKGLNPDAGKAAESYNIISRLFRWWPMTLSVFSKEISDIAVSGRHMWPEETDGPVDVLKTDGYVVYVSSSEYEFDLRWIIGSCPIRMDHESTRGCVVADIRHFDVVDALGRVYEAGSMLGDTWQRMLALFNSARERGETIVSDGSLDLS